MDWITSIARNKPSATLKPVNCTKCRFNRSTKIQEEARIILCKTYYALGDYNRQRDYLRQRISLEPVGNRHGCKKKRSTSEVFIFHINDQIIRVCKKFFTSTSAVSNKACRVTLADKTTEDVFGGSNQRGRHAPKNFEQCANDYTSTYR